MIKWRRLYIAFLCAMLGGILTAQSLKAEMPDTWSGARTAFWNSLYVEGGETFYCGDKFMSSDGIDMEHIYPRSWAMEYLGCTDTLSECRKNYPKFKLFEADLFNLVPARSSVNRSRQNLPFGIIDGEDYRYSDCDYERNSDVAEPRDEVRGDIARILFYVRDTYGFPIKGDISILDQWNKNDPVSCKEATRYYKINKLVR